jgi:hypothetical protein
MVIELSNGDKFHADGLKCSDCTEGAISADRSTPTEKTPRKWLIGLSLIDTSHPRDLGLRGWDCRFRTIAVKGSGAFAHQDSSAF